MQKHYKRLEQIYLSAPITHEIYPGTTIKITNEKAEITSTVLNKHCHIGGTLHGSGYFRMLDDAAYFAVSSVVHDYFIYTVSFNINIVRPVLPGKVRAVGKVKFKSKNLYIADATLYNDVDTVIAFGIGNFMKSKNSLSSVSDLF